MMISNNNKYRNALMVIYRQVFLKVRWSGNRCIMPLMIFLLVSIFLLGLTQVFDSSSALDASEPEMRVGLYVILSGMP